jgi:hypothetical protein
MPRKWGHTWWGVLLPPWVVESKRQQNEYFKFKKYEYYTQKF